MVVNMVKLKIQISHIRLTMSNGWHGIVEYVLLYTNTIPIWVYTIVTISYHKTPIRSLKDLINYIELKK